jgi:anti-sigma factor RsiW
MSNVSEQLERLIVRRLDGELSPEEELELDRELIRDPAARELYERYAALDAMAARVLGRVATPRVPDAALAAPASAAASASREHVRAWWMIAGSAIAAGLAIIVLLKTPLTPTATQEPKAVTNRAEDAWSPTVAAPIPVLAPSGKDVGVWRVPANAVPPQVDRAVKRNLIVVPGGDGSYYLLNLEQVKEVQSPARPLPASDPI